MLTMKVQMGQIMETMQVMARGQEEIGHANLRVVAVNPFITLPLGGAGTPIVTQPPPKGSPVNQNVGPIVNIHVIGGAQPEIDDHPDAFFIPRVDSVCDAFGPSTAKVEKKLCVLYEKMKTI